MSELITLEETRLYCRIDPDNEIENTLIEGLIAAALEVCQKHIGKRFDDGLVFTPAMKIGCLMYVAMLYETREMVSELEKAEVPMTVSALWSVYRDVGIY